MPIFLCAISGFHRRSDLVLGLGRTSTLVVVPLKTTTSAKVALSEGSLGAPHVAYQTHTLFKSKAQLSTDLHFEVVH